MAYDLDPQDEEQIAARQKFLNGLMPWKQPQGNSFSDRVPTPSQPAPAPQPAPSAAPEIPKLGAPTESPTLGQPKEVPHPARQELETALGQAPTPSTGVKGFFARLGRAHPIGEMIEESIPGTVANYQDKVRGLKSRADLEATQISRTLGEQKSQQEIQDEPGKVALTKRNTESEIAARGDKDSSALAKMGLVRDSNGNVVADENSPIYKQNQAKEQRAQNTEQSLESLRQSQSDLNAARTEVEKSKNDPNSPVYKQAQQRLQMAQRAHDIAEQNLGLHQQQFANKLQEQDFVKPGGQAQSRASAAQAALDVLPGLRGLVKKNGPQMGALMGRINRGELAIGNVDPEVAELYGAMKSFYALQPAVHGFRSAEFVKDLETAIGTLERNPDAFLAGMEGLKPTLESVAKEGLTFRKRIMEGGQPAQGAPANATVIKYDAQGNRIK